MKSLTDFQLNYILLYSLKYGYFYQEVNVSSLILTICKVCMSLLKLCQPKSLTPLTAFSFQNIV